MAPKTLKADNVADFRPIPCLNEVYKVIAKLMARILQNILPLMISENQTTFVNGMQIMENILIASEMVQGYNNMNTTKRGMIEIDLKGLRLC